jgi:S-adenosyl-L-methionine hydrolase (adenosine-forming)
MNRQPIITLTTDFGTADGYVGAVRGVILSICPQAVIVDITHEIPPQDVAHAAFSLHSAARYYPPGTIHLAVVDPGVGTDRRHICVTSGDQVFIGPDNGLFSPFMGEDATVIELAENEFWLEAISLTFHGRDIFGPVAAHLGCGVEPGKLGPEIQDPVLLASWKNVIRPGRLEGAIVHIDHFGNCMTSFTPDQIESMGPFSIWMPGNGSAPESGIIRNTYADVDLGEACWLVGSVGLVELAVNGGNAEQTFGIERGDPVMIESKE